MQSYHHVERLYGRTFYGLNSRAVIYFRYSKRHGRDQYFFGVESDDIAKFAANNLFIMFICQDEKNVFALPLQEFQGMVDGSEAISGQWKVFIEPRDDRWFLRVARKGRYEITEFRNYFDFTPPGLRASLPSVGLFIPIKQRPSPSPRKELPDQPPEDLAESLILTASESRRFFRLEEVVVQVFNALGLQAQREGGSGNTDVLITGPFRAIIECKSTASSSLSSVNFARIKRHMIRHEGVAAAVVSVRFDRAVQDDAVSEGIALIEAQALANFLRSTADFPPSAATLWELLSRRGLIGPEQWVAARSEAMTVGSRLSRLSHVLEVLDFTERSTEEIKGRLARYGDYTSEEIHEALGYFALPIFSILEVGAGGYRLTLSLERARTRIRTTLATLSGA